MALDLYTRLFGSKDKPVIIVLHGLLGSSRNWQSVASALSADWSVYALDLRNHGRSPQSDEMNYDCMEEDLVQWVAKQNLDKFVLIGHSLGGKLAMGYACNNPERVKSLVVVDIAPRDYPPHHELKFDIMNTINPGDYETRGEVEKFLESRISDWALRKFLVTNLIRDEISGRLQWQINLKALTGSLPELAFSPLGWEDRFEGSTLFLRGSESDFIEDDDRIAVDRHFPNNEIITVQGAGHNIHMEKRETFLRLLNEFLKQS